MLRKISIFLILLIFTTSCGQRTEKTNDFNKFSQKFNSYKANAEITVYGNKGTSKYKVVQYFMGQSKLRIEVLEPNNLKGNIIIYNDNNKTLYNPLINEKVVLPKGQDDKFTYMGIITKEVFFNENTKAEKERRGDIEYIKIKAAIPESNKYKKTAGLYMDEKNYYPVLMEVIDEAGRITMTVKYNSFELNPDFDESIFTIQ